jgi:hypothetical protein
VSPLDFMTHLLGFIAPALVVAALVALAGKVVFSRNNPAKRWWHSFALNSIAGIGVLVVGLWVFGRDGKMATYVALVLVVATTQWLSSRGWQS